MSDGQPDLNSSAAAWHGLALNLAYPLGERLEFALKAMELYEARVELLHSKLDHVRAIASFRV
jgi:hypothetical protein